MKLQLDTKNKTIKVEENVNIEEFYKVIKKMFPNDLWKKFTLETNTVINYSPWIIWSYNNPYYSGDTISPYPWYTYISEENGTTTIPLGVGDLEEGIYNIDALIQ